MNWLSLVHRGFFKSVIFFCLALDDVYTYTTEIKKIDSQIVLWLKQKKKNVASCYSISNSDLILLKWNDFETRTDIFIVFFFCLKKNKSEGVA